MRTAKISREERVGCIDLFAIFAMNTNLPYWLRSALELHGIENDQLDFREGALAIHCDTPEEAFGLRDVALSHTACNLSTHPTTRKPTVNLPEFNQ